MKSRYPWCLALAALAAIATLGFEIRAGAEDRAAGACAAEGCPGTDACGAGVIDCSSGVGDENHCCRCGACCSCGKVCRRVCEMKEVAKTTYSCKCEDFCVLGKSCEKDCEGCCNPHLPASRPWCWIPTAAYVKTKRVPEKKTETKQVPTYTFKVVCLCPSCCDCTK